MNVFAKIGIILLVLGFALLGRMALIAMGPGQRVALIYAVSAAMLGGGIWLETKERYRLLGRAGIGGGWASAVLHHLCDAPRFCDGGARVQHCRLRADASGGHQHGRAHAPLQVASRHRPRVSARLLDCGPQPGQRLRSQCGRYSGPRDRRHRAAYELVRTRSSSASWPAMPITSTGSTSSIPMASLDMPFRSSGQASSFSCSTGRSSASLTWSAPFAVPATKPSHRLQHCLTPCRC